MKTFLKLAALTTVLVSGLSSPVEAQARRQERVVIFYESDAHMTIVGQNVFFCDGGVTHVGGRSMYTDEIYYGCN